MEQFTKETDIEASMNPIGVMKREQYSNLLYTLNEYAAIITVVVNMLKTLAATYSLVYSIRIFSLFHSYFLKNPILGVIS
jgi:hypothetical protein